MTFIKWRNSFSVGIDIIDEQHKKLIAIINELCVAQQQSTSQTIISEILDELVDYTNYHFSYEEKMLEERKYPDLGDQMDEHKEFVTKIATLHFEKVEGNLLISIKTLDYLKDWIINHILGSDMEYAKYFKENVS